LGLFGDYTHSPKIDVLLLNFTKMPPPMKSRIFSCGMKKCLYSSSSAYDLEKHVFDQHRCTFCGKDFFDKITHLPCSFASNSTLQSNVPMLGGGKNDDILRKLDGKKNMFLLVKTCHDGALFCFEYDYSKHAKTILNLEDAISIVNEDLRSLLLAFLDGYNTFKFKITFTLTLLNLKTQERNVRYFNSIYFRILHENFIQDTTSYAVKYIDSMLRLFENTSSGQSIVSVDKLQISIGKYKPSSIGKGFFGLPITLQRKHGMIVPKCPNNCFLLCVAAKFFKHLFFKRTCITSRKFTFIQRQSLKRKLENPKTCAKILRHIKDNGLLQTEGFEGAVDIQTLSWWENINKMSVSVYSYKKKHGLFPLRLTQKKLPRHITLLLLHAKEIDRSPNCDPDEQHYILIDDESRFFRNTSTHTQLVCRYCANKFSKQKIGEHETLCLNVAASSISYTPDDNYEFKEKHKLMNPPYFITASVLPLMHANAACKIIGFSLQALGPKLTIVYSKTYVGEDACQEFAKVLKVVSTHLLDLQKQTHLPLISTEDIETQRKIPDQKCPICLKKMGTSENAITRHHSHYIENYLHADGSQNSPVQLLCNTCNLGIKAKWYLPVFIVNISSTALNVMLPTLKSAFKNLSIIPRNKNEIIGVFVRNRLRIVCWENFLEGNLTQLIEQCRTNENIHNFESFDAMFGGKIYPSFFPHTAIKEEKELRLQTSLPDPTSFFDVCYMRNVTKQEHQHMNTSFSDFNCTNLLDYSTWWLKYRVLGMTSVLLSLNEFVMKHYKLTMLYDVTFAAYAYSASMFNSQADFHYVKSDEIIRRVTDSTIGPISHLTLRKIDANNELLKHSSVTNENRTFILCADLNSLYATSMKFELPVGNYYVLSDDEVKCFDVNKLKYTHKHAQFTSARAVA